MINVVDMNDFNTPNSTLNSNKDCFDDVIVLGIIDGDVKIDCSGGLTPDEIINHLLKAVYKISDTDALMRDAVNLIADPRFKAGA